MTKKDYELIADVLTTMRYSSGTDNSTEALYKSIVLDFALRLRDTNPKFNPDRFIRACGL